MPTGVYKRTEEHLSKLKGKIPWNKWNNTYKNKECENCKSIFRVGGRGNARKWAEFCSKKCANVITQFKKWQTSPNLGKPNLKIRWENNNNWKWGITKENHKIRSSLEFSIWRNACFERDDYTCQKTKKRWWKIVVHHINNFADFPELRTDINNWITLSIESHREFHKKYWNKNTNREQLSEFLTNLS